MSAAQKKTRRAPAGSVWKQLAREIALAFCHGAPWLAIGISWGLMAGMGVRS